MLIYDKKFLIFFLLFLSLIISFILGENSSGGSQHDFLATKKYIDAFQIDFFSGIQLFKINKEPLLPSFYLIIANISNYLGLTFVKYFYILLSSLIPIVFYKILKKKFVEANNDLLFLISIIIFLSPYFRSSAIWLTGENLALLFFLLSINSFINLEFQIKKLLPNVLICFFFLILASYIRHYYAIFFIYYFFNIAARLTFFENFLVIFFNFILSIPVILYFLYFIENGSLNQSFHYVGSDFIFNILVFTSLFLFYFIPFIFNSYAIDHFKKNLFIKKKFILLSIFLCLLIYVFYNIPVTSLGGGVLYKVSEIFYSKLFYIFGFLGILFLVIFNENNLKNNLIYLILIIMFPLDIIYQKYYDPLIYILIFTLIDSRFVKELIKNNNFKILIVLGYYLIFLIGSNFYYYN